jgi:hypothetical protein
MRLPFTYSKIVAALTIASGILALLCLVLLSIALTDHPEAISDPVQILQVPDLNISLIRASMLADIAGYYLLLLPLIYYLRPYFRKHTAWADLLTFCATAYALGGAIGAAIMSEVVTRLYTEYYQAVPAGQESIRAVFRSVIYLVYEGLWNLLGSLFAGIWWLLMGYALLASHKALGWVTTLLGAFTLLDALGHMSGIQWLAEIGLNVYLVIAPLWAIWMGVVIWKRTTLLSPLPELHQVA